MEQLKLPDFEIKLREDTIFCLIRKKWVTLTPEEWVRQHFINLLTEHLNYPRGLVSVEQPMRYAQRDKRSDIIVLDREAGVFLVVECKATYVKLDEKVIKQVAVYNKILNAKYVAVTNGLSHFIWQKKQEHYIQLNEFPLYI